MQYKIIDLEQGSDAWHEFRSNKIGASEVASIMGIDPFCTPYAKWSEKVFGKTRYTTKAMARGHEQEPMARKWSNDTLGTKYSPLVVQSIKHPFLIASLDGWDEDHPYSVLEIKSPLKVKGSVPEHYNLQVQTQMWLTNTEHAYYCEWDGEKGQLFLIDRNAEKIKEIEKAVVEFHRRIVDLDPPPTDEVIVSDEQSMLDSERLEDLDRLMVELETERSEIRQRIIEKCQGNAVSRVGAYRVTEVVKRGIVDYSKIPELQGVNLDNYRKAPSNYWRIS